MTGFVNSIVIICFKSLFVDRLGPTTTLTLPLPSLLVPTPFTRGGGGVGRSPCYLKKRCSHELETETSFNVLEMLKFFTFLSDGPIIIHFKNVIFMWVGKSDFREAQMEM